MQKNEIREMKDFCISNNMNTEKMSFNEIMQLHNTFRYNAITEH